MFQSVRSLCLMGIQFFVACSFLPPVGFPVRRVACLDILVDQTHDPTSCEISLLITRSSVSVSGVSSSDSASVIRLTR